VKFIITLIVFVVTVLVIAFSFFPGAPQFESTEADRGMLQVTLDQPVAGPIQPIRGAMGLDPEKISLGAQLFNDTILSEDNTVSCASCHSLEMGGTNGLRLSVGIGGGIQQINVPTVFNSSLNFAQFWDGRAKTLEEQVSGPIENPLEMGSTWTSVVSRVNANSAYSKQFAKLYAKGVTKESISHALAEFERSLTTPNSAFDRYLKGDKNALNEEQIAGYQLFEELGCIRCHQGMGIGGNMFQRMGAKRNYFADRDDLNVHDMGRFNVTGDEYDRHWFKVPSLRNIALTAPYFHDGSAATLVDAIQTMAKYQLGRRLKDQEEQLLLGFLSSLTGEYNGVKLSLRKNVEVDDKDGKKL
jgi:cytochrome c peroxidase